jgi:hypothetical protein
MGANGNAPRLLEHALPTGSSATRADGVCRSCDVRGQTRNQSPSCDVPISASQPNATRTRTPAARASSQHSSRTAAAQQPRHSCRVAGLWPDLSRKRAGTQPEVSWNSAKRYSAIGDQQNQDVGIALSSESDAATVRLGSGCSPAAVWLSSGSVPAMVWIVVSSPLRAVHLPMDCVTALNANGQIAVSGKSGSQVSQPLSHRRGRSAPVVGYPSL